MERLDFIEKIFTLYRVNPENNKNLIIAYDEAFSTNKPVDWDKLYKRVLIRAEGGLPKPTFFISQFDGCLKPRDYKTADGLRLRVNSKTGYSYEYETYHENRTLEEIKIAALSNRNTQSIELYDEVKLEWVRI